MTVYQVRLIHPASGLDRTIPVAAGDYILDAAEEMGIALPSGCKQGDCSACVARLLEGELDQTEQKFLRPAELALGYRVTCVASPLSNCVLETHQEERLYKSSLYRPSEPQDDQNIPTA